MPAASNINSTLDQLLLQQLAERLKRARVKRGLTTTQMAQKAGISRMTLRAVEAGAPAPTMGTYLRVMSVLGVSQDLALVANDTIQGAAAKDAGEWVSSKTLIEPLPRSGAQHELQDLQSLMLHEEAVRLMRRNPELIQQALDNLERWRSAGDSHSRFLWDEWSVILHRRAWRRAVSLTQRGKELRQASPLTTVLPAEVRHRVLQQVQQLKEGNG
jgi:transcriptional regulator with XRE-family HTH domain